MEKIKIGVSSCLLGEKVRFDAQHKYHWYINEVLSKYFDYVRMCPELEVGMGVPRKSVRLEGDLNSPRMIEPKSGEDWTSKMETYSQEKVSMLEDLSGFLFKKGSPSCGPFRVRVYQKTGIPLVKGMGIFARAFTEKYPLIPFEDEGRLNDAGLRESFIERVFAYQRIKTLMKKRFSRGNWVKFHERSKFLILAHSRPHYTKLGQLVAGIKSYSPHDFKEAYASLYMEALAVKSTQKKNCDVLLHILGFLKKILGSKEKQDLLATIESYRNKIVPLAVPLTLLKHYIKVHEIPYVEDQFYLDPHPHDLSLRTSL